MKETLFDKLLQKDSVTAIRRLVIGALMAAATPFGWGLIVATGAACIAINALVFRQEKVTEQKKLAGFYKSEIAALEHIPEDNVTIDSLKQAAEPVEQGGKGVSALKDELQHLKSQQSFRFGLSTISSLITTAILVGIVSFYPPFRIEGGLNMVLGLGLIGLGHTVIARTVRAIGECYLGDHDFENSPNQRLMRIGANIKDNPVSPVEVFGLFAECNPELAANIKARFGTDYANLPILQKKQVVQTYEAQYRTIALSEEMNKGTIKPSITGLAMCGFDSDAIPGLSSYKALASEPVRPMVSHAFDLEINNLANFRQMVKDRQESITGPVLH